MAKVIYRETLRAQDEARAIIEQAKAEAAELRANATRSQQRAAAKSQADREALEARVVDVVVEAVRVLLETELEARPELVVALVRRGLRLAADPEATVKLHPMEISHFPGAQADAELTRGSCVVESGGAEVRCTPRTLSEGLRALWTGP